MREILELKGHLALVSMKITQVIFCHVTFAVNIKMGIFFFLVIVLGHFQSVMEIDSAYRPIVTW